MRSVIAVVTALVVCVAIARFDDSTPVLWEGPVERLSKLDATTHEIADTLGGLETSAFVLCPSPPRDSRLALELVQLLPDVRLIISRRIILRWYLGNEEVNERAGLLGSFYHGTMTLAGFAALRERFPVDWAVVDEETGDAGRQRALLQEAGWERIRSVERYEVWKLP